MRRVVVYLVVALTISFLGTSAVSKPKKRNYPYFEIEGTASDFKFNRNWRSYYWREDFTMLVRDAKGKQWRIISREPTPWNNLRSIYESCPPSTPAAL